ncbi:Homing endonuclease LAGLIDADG domain-containing protein [Candidatus Magnetomoraceae bacterium gMMP-15]
MLTVRGSYKKGKIILPQDVMLDNQLDVLVIFLDERKIMSAESSLKKKFSFKKSRKLLKNYKGSLSQAVIEERMGQL